ncbi:MBL fold metallo-hydrolase [Streptomyces sp. NBC_01352]|uniref:MBL fold metallo-hydrolase n=1 Tax=Streptomyces sp. NBC_01352 TaxID=2903834 RepID=UPI002E360523|nr:MBL fold metallo-hydrolase [Streptomyces sp. NBC_01352]
MTEARITHIGGPTTLIEAAGWRLLTDPTFDPPGRRYSFGWGTSSRKTSGPALKTSELPPLDAVLLTHDHHADNLDTAGRALLPSADVVLTTRSGAVRLGGTAHGLAPWDTWRLESPGRPAIEVIATPARHGPPLSRPLVGEVTGFALRWEGQRHGALWVTGDTVLYDGVREVAQRVDVGTVLLHLGGVRFPLTGPLRYTMTAAPALELCRLLRPRTVLPVHYEGWSHFQEGRRAVEAALAAADADLSARFTWLPAGTPLDVTV